MEYSPAARPAHRFRSDGWEPLLVAFDSSLLVPKSDHWIGTHGTSRGEIARQYGHAAQEYRHGDEGRRIGRGDPVEQRRKKLYSSKCDAEADSQANYGQKQ